MIYPQHFQFIRFAFKIQCKARLRRLKVLRLAHLLIVDNASVSSGFADVVTALILFLTIPVTVAITERTFLKLKIIMSYLRNFMGQTRLRGLSLLAIEASRAKSMNIAQLIDRKAGGLDCKLYPTEPSGLTCWHCCSQLLSAEKLLQQ